MPATIAGKLVIMSPTHGCVPPKNAWSGLRSTHGFLWRPLPCNACQACGAKGPVSGEWTPLPSSPVVLKHEGLPGSEVSKERLHSAKRAPVISTSMCGRLRRDGTEDPSDRQINHFTMSHRTPE